MENGRIQPVARIKGVGGGYSLIFNGHMDTDVLWLGEKDPFVPRIIGRRLYGHGIYNMLGGVAAMVEAAVAVKEAGVKLKGDLIVTPVVGELQGGVGTVANIKRGIVADFGLVPEPYDECLVTAHTGVMEIAITLRGRCHHITHMEEAINVSHKMVRVIDALNKMKFNYTPDPRFPGLPRMIVGSGIFGHGETYDLKGANHVPDYCTIVIDIRFLPRMQPDRDVTKVLERIKSEDPEFEYEMQVTPDAPDLPGMPWKNFRLTMPFQDLSLEERIVKAYAQNYEYVTGEKPLVGVPPKDHQAHSHVYAGNDDAHLTKAGIPSFVCGPKGDFDRKLQGLQYVDIDSMIRVAKVFALTAYDICTESK